MLFFNGMLRNPTEFAFMKRFFIGMHVFPFCGILRNLHLWRDSLWECMFSPFYGILRNFEEYSLWEWMFFLWYVLITWVDLDWMHALYLYGILRNLHLWRDSLSHDSVDAHRALLSFEDPCPSLRQRNCPILWGRDSLSECMFSIFYGILRNSTEFAFMKRFFIRMHVFPLLRNSTEFRGIYFVGVDVFSGVLWFLEEI